MGISTFDALAARVVKSMPLTSLKDSVIGVDATYYLEGLLAPSKEPLLSALGGFPLALEPIIAKDLVNLQSAGLKLHFVFNGLEYGSKDDAFKASIASAQKNAMAFDIYEKDIATESINVFRTSGIPTPAALSEFLKRVLYENNVEFTVAPYSAMAQLAYYERDPSQFIDAIYGSSELFLFGVDKLITKWELIYNAQESNDGDKPKKVTRFVLEDSRFTWIDRRICLDELGHVPVETFVDACLLAGSSLLRTFPPLENPTVYTKGYSMRDVVNLIISCGRSVTSVCAQYQDDAQVKQLDYLDRYRRAVTAIKHHIIIAKDGNVETLDSRHAPSDVHDCIGQRLPEELNMYLSRGMLRPRVLTWLTSGAIFVTAPYDGGNSREYQNLVRSQLEPWRRQALCLLSDSVHRYYQRKEITTKFWYEEDYAGNFNIKDLLPSPKNLLRTWHVKDSLIHERRVNLKIASGDVVPGSLYFAVLSLADEAFALKTISSKPAVEEPLRTSDGITTNTIWRLLQLREYVDSKHQLTAWGAVLEATLKSLGPNKNLEEAAFIAVELMRLGLLNPDTMFPDYSGAPLRGTDTDRRNCMLVSRVASLGKLRHQPRGYSGPLSRHLLAYHSIVSAVHSSLRDLAEMSLVTMFLEGDADRERNDWMELSLRLPFYNENSCALGIAVKTYLDELCTRDDPTSASTRAEMREKGQGWIEYSDFNGSLGDAFQLWDAVYMGVTTAGGKVKDGKMWEDVDKWLSCRR